MTTAGLSPVEDYADPDAESERRLVEEQEQRDERLFMFRSRWPEAWDFFAQLWERPESSYPLEEWADIIGQPTDPGQPDYTDEDVVQWEDASRTLDEMFVRRDWQPEVKRYGARALVLAEKVHAWRAHREQNNVRAATIDRHADRPVIPYLVDKLIPSHVPVGIIGLKEAGKSFLAVDLACCNATGTEWLGRVVTQGRVLLLILEDIPEIPIERIGAWELAHPKVPSGLLDENLKVIRPDGFDIGSGKSTHHLFEMIREDGFSTVIVDNLDAGRIDTSNMSDEDVGGVIATMRGMANAGATVIMVSHTNQKDEHAAGLSRYENQLNTILHVKWRRNERIVALTKSKTIDKTTFKPIRFRLVSSEVETASGLPTATVEMVGLDDGARDAIREAFGELEGVSSKNAILEMVQELGYKIERTRGLRLITELADDPDDRVIRRGKGFVLVGDD